MKFSLCFLLLLPLFATADEFVARVVNVHDADTIVVVQNQRTITIRMKGIDCPEVGAPAGLRAKKYASDNILNKNVTLKTYGKDKYGRTLADVFLENNNLFNQELVRSGNCKWGRSRAMRP